MLLQDVTDGLSCVPETGRGFDVSYVFPSHKRKISWACTQVQELHRVPPPSYGTTAPTVNAPNPSRRSVDGMPAASRREIVIRTKPGKHTLRSLIHLKANARPSATPKSKYLSPLPVRPMPSSHVSA